MARIRNIKPAFFKDSELFDAETETGLPLRVAYAGLWTIADRKGRFQWRPREIKTDVLPYDNVDMAAVLAALVKCQKIFNYKAAGGDYGFIPKFEQHQFINKNEAQSVIPPPPENSNAPTGSQQPRLIHYETQTQDTGILDIDTDDGIAPPAPPSKPPRRVLSALSEDFPTAEGKRLACAYWEGRNRSDLIDEVEDQARSFRAHHLMHGSRMADWDQAWITWYGKALKFNRKPGQSNFPQAKILKVVQ